MRVIFIGRSHAFSLLPLASVGTEHDIVGVIESAPRGASSRPSQRVRRRLRTAVARRSSADSLPHRARFHGARYMWLDRQTRPRLLPLVRSLQPDVICVASLSYLLPKELLAAATFGAINLHPSLLPLYHGPFPWFWQYHDFRLDIGVTVHQLDEGQDTGPILAQVPMRLALGTDIHDAMHQAGSLGADLMRSVVRSLADGASVPRSQIHGALPKARTVARSERFIDWDAWSLERVWHFMRGTYPWVDHFERPPELANAGYGVGAMQTTRSPLPPGSLGRDEEGWFTAHPCGKIRVLFHPRE